MTMTKYSEAILEIINTSMDHPTAMQIYERLQASYPNAVLATVYNNLQRLYERNLIRRISVDGMADRYDRNTRHDHLVCRKCGSLKDVHLCDLSGILESQVDVEMLSYDLRISCICPRCAGAE